MLQQLYQIIGHINYCYMDIEKIKSEIIKSYVEGGYSLNDAEDSVKSADIITSNNHNYVVVIHTNGCVDKFMIENVPSLVFKSSC